MKRLSGCTVAVAVFALSGCGNADRQSDRQIAGSVAESVAASTEDLAAPATHCKLAAGPIQHVIYLVFDNVHLRRDNPKVPSDLEQMPHLLDFLTRNGTLDANHHTPLIAHTATDILTSLSGLYPDRMGMGVSNTYKFFNPDGTSDPALSFAYWAAPIFDFVTSTPADNSPTMVTVGGKIAPAPWVPYTRAGCDFAAAGTANVELENLDVDIPTMFGANSPQVKEVAADRDLATADFVGVSVHCAKGSPLCDKPGSGAIDDKLPDEPHGYNGFKALVGQKYVAPAISSTPLTDLDGNVINDGLGHVGFPGFNGMQATTTLGYIAAMQEAGIPITTAYISTAHEDPNGGQPRGPGEALYVAHLKAYDDAFAKFFDRITKDGLTPENTLFVIHSDENDHFAGSAPTPADCDGVHTPCTYAALGQVLVNVTALLAQKGVTASFDVATSLAMYVDGNPGPDAALTRTFERASATLEVTSPYSGKTQKLAHFIADRTEMDLLHMTSADPLRTPTFTIFTKAEDALNTGGTTCDDPANPCVSLDNTEVWVHGNFAPEINHTWLGIVGPGVKKLGVYDGVWSDHTDVRPTVLSLLGLEDSYTHEGRVISELLTESAEPAAARHDEAGLEKLGAVFKQLNAPVGDLAAATLEIATRGAASGSPSDDSEYQHTTAVLKALGEARGFAAGRIEKVLDDAWFHGVQADPAEVRELIADGEALIATAKALAKARP
jgi:hypothetical protein